MSISDSMASFYQVSVSICIDFDMFKDDKPNT